MNKKLVAVDLTENSIETMIYEVRGERVMLDFDLARIYGYTTRKLNEQVKNNIKKFPEDFMFQLSRQELEQILRSKKSTANEVSSKRRYNPYAFTEQGIYMLMTVLKGELAIEQSKTLIRLFKKMKDYIGEIANNPNNVIVDNKRPSIIKEYNQIIESNNRIGYLVINNYKVSNDIVEKLGVKNSLALLVSKGKLMSICRDHNLTAEQFADAIKKASYSPEAIVYDAKRHSFQFYVKLKDDSYRTVIEFGAVPIGMKNIKANILTTLFMNNNYEKRIRYIKEQKFPSLFLRYEKRSGWASIATDSSKDTISNDNCGVHKRKG